eukprot:TRINITY_DN57594_c0_g1_i1.p1 TRINITY_DN57594_c0_g1~~TRINITY_DN57594_c0_g1_i1.p1  ORF type:complete len:115 (+),score=41.40 TRINITY_DN57594_c0_g1_i1:70-414(+)
MRAHAQMFVALALCLLNIPAWCESDENDLQAAAEQLLKEVDENKDGKASLLEIATSVSKDLHDEPEEKQKNIDFLNKHFASKDVDGDELLDKAELAQLIDEFSKAEEPGHGADL